MPISTIGQNGLNAPITLTSPVINTVTSAASTALTLQSAGTTAITVNTSQNVGIGTSSPAKKLDVNGDALVTQLVIRSDDSDIMWTDSGSRPLIRGNKTNNTLAFYTSSAERMRISSSGFVGINEVAPATLLHMTNGTLRIDGTTAQAIYIRGAATIKPYISINEFGTRQWDIGAGYYSAGTFSIQSNQTNGVYLGGTATAWASASDERIKDIIEPISNALTKVNGLRSVIGKYKTDEEGIRRSFLIAQDIQTQFPEALESSNSERLGVQYTDVIPLLVASIKELKAIVNAQAAEIAELKAKVA